MPLSMSIPVAVLLGVVALLVVITAVGTARPARPRRLPERWSVDVLRHVRGWQVLAAPDGSGVDRVVVAPGAVLAVVVRDENTETDRLAALAGAEHVRRALRTGRECTAHPVVAVLAVTGRNALPVDGHHAEDTVHVVDGIRPERWLQSFASPDIAADERQAIVSAIAPDTGLTRSGRLMWWPARGAA